MSVKLKRWKIVCLIWSFHLVGEPQFGELDPSRMIRGLMVEMEAGQEMLSLLISAEGHLTPLFHIEDAEKNLFDAPRLLCEHSRRHSFRSRRHRAFARCHPGAAV